MIAFKDAHDKQRKQLISIFIKKIHSQGLTKCFSVTEKGEILCLTRLPPHILQLNNMLDVMQRNGSIAGQWINIHQINKAFKIDKFDIDFLEKETKKQHDNTLWNRTAAASNDAKSKSKTSINTKSNHLKK